MLIVLCRLLNLLVMMKGVTGLPCPPEPPHPSSTQVEGALSGIEESVHATFGPLKDAEQSVEALEAKAHPSMPTLAKEESQGPHLWRVAQGAGWLPKRCIGPASV